MATIAQVTTMKPWQDRSDGKGGFHDPVEEWSLLPLVYKNAVSSRRAAWRVITSTEQEEKFKGKEELVLHAREYVAKVEG